MPGAACSQVSGRRPAGALGSEVDIADTRVAGSPDCTGCAGLLCPNSESTDAGPTVVEAASTARRVNERSAQAWVSNRAQLSPVAYPSNSRAPGVDCPAAAARDATATAAG